MKRILSNDGVKKETFHMDNSGIVTIQSQTDVTNVLKENKFKRDQASAHHTEEVFNHKARIPADVLKQWCNIKGIKTGEFLANKDHLKSFLNDSDNKVWLTRLGKV